MSDREWTVEGIYQLKFIDIAALHNEALAAEREVGHNTAVALAQQITKLEDQVQTLRDALAKISTGRWPPESAAIAKDALAKVEE